MEDARTDAKIIKESGHAHPSKGNVPLWLKKKSFNANFSVSLFSLLIAIVAFPIGSCNSMRNAKSPDIINFSLVSYPNSWTAFIDTKSGKGEFKERNAAPKKLSISLQRSTELRVLTEKVFGTEESFEIGRSAPDSSFRIISFNGFSAKLHNVNVGDLSNEEKTSIHLFDEAWRNLLSETLVGE